MGKHLVIQIHIIQLIFKTFSKMQSIAGIYALYAFPSHLHNNRNRQTCTHTNFIICNHFKSLNIFFFLFNHQNYHISTVCMDSILQ